MPPGEVHRDQAEELAALGGGCQNDYQQQSNESLSASCRRWPVIDKFAKANAMLRGLVQPWPQSASLATAVSSNQIW